MSDSISDLNCGNCLFWKRIPNPDPQIHGGICRRHPPVPMAIPGNALGISFWPITSGQDWCGEHAEQELTYPVGMERAPSHQTLGMAIQDLEDNKV